MAAACITLLCVAVLGEQLHPVGVRRTQCLIVMANDCSLLTASACGSDGQLSPDCIMHVGDQLVHESRSREQNHPMPSSSARQTRRVEYVTLQQSTGRSGSRGSTRSRTRSRGHDRRRMRHSTTRGRGHSSRTEVATKAGKKRIRRRRVKAHRKPPIVGGSATTRTKRQAIRQQARKTHVVSSRGQMFSPILEASRTLSKQQS
eukprot:5856289-Amphidinium_carterae.1